MKLGDIADFRYGKMPQKTLTLGKYPIYSGYRITGFTNDEYNSDEDLIIVARGVGGTGDIKISPPKSFVTNLSIIADLDTKQLDKKYALYFFSKGLRHLDSGSAQSQITIQDLNAISLRLPSIDIQKRIAEILSAFDEKIKNNNCIIKTLEEMAQAIFKEWFVKFRFPGHEKVEIVDSPLGKIPKGWKIKALDEVADFLNGIALQNFRPKDTESSLPVIKIREMNNGIDSNTERASRDIDEKYKVNAGDILFSWSGSLELMRWSATTGALNQHLFKVTSQNYPTWFVFYWVKHHLPYFKLIASSKATSMGHIQRHHLSEATVVVPSPDILDQADKLIFPMFEQALKLRIENQELAAMRDLLLPRLMSGEIEINI